MMSPNQLISLTVKNFRSLADVSIHTQPLTVLFGPNGAGKSALLDALWFVRECGIRGVDIAASNRSHGIGLLWEGADDGTLISIAIETQATIYEIFFGYSSGRIETFVGENLFSKTQEKILLNRKVGSDKAILNVESAFKRDSSIQ